MSVVDFRHDSKMMNVTDVHFQVGRCSRYMNDLIFGVLTLLSAIFQLYHGDQF
jgi:hypothetical protein